MLKAFRNPEEWLTSSELSRRANLPEASGYRLIQTLEEIGAVVRGPRGRYRPGMLLVSLSQNVIISELLKEAGQKISADLSTRLNVTAHLGLLEGGMVTYLIRAATPTAYPAQTQAGSQLEAYCSGLGKVLLAALPTDQLDVILLEGELVPLTAKTITDKAVLRTHLAQIRTRGYAVDDGEFRSDMCCVAVPVRDDKGRTVAAMSVSECATEMSPEREAELRQELMAASAAISRKVWPSGPTLCAEGKPRVGRAA
jgi:IclR family acetate operon transcriptional repressor